MQIFYFSFFNFPDDFSAASTNRQSRLKIPDAFCSAATQNARLWACSHRAQESGSCILGGADVSVICHHARLLSGVATMPVVCLAAAAGISIFSNRSLIRQRHVVAMGRPRNRACSVIFSPISGGIVSSVFIYFSQHYFNLSLYKLLFEFILIYYLI